MRSREKLAGFIRNVSVHFNTRIVLHFAALEIFNGDEHVQFPSGAIKGDHSCHWKRLNFQKLDNLDVAFQFSIERSLSTDKEIKISFFFYESYIASIRCDIIACRWIIAFEYIVPVYVNNCFNEKRRNTVTNTLAMIMVSLQCILFCKISIESVPCHLKFQLQTIYLSS